MDYVCLGRVIRFGRQPDHQVVVVCGRPIGYFDIGCGLAVKRALRGGAKRRSAKRALRLVPSAVMEKACWLACRKSDAPIA
jgi:hypothetical protein